MADVFTHFNYLHAIPEIGMKEFKTSAYVADVLKRLGYEVETQVGGAFAGMTDTWPCFLRRRKKS